MTWVHSPPVSGLGTSSRYDLLSVPSSLSALVPSIATLGPRPRPPSSHSYPPPLSQQGPAQLLSPPPLPRSASNASSTTADSSVSSHLSSSVSNLQPHSYSPHQDPHSSALMPPPPLPRKRKLGRERSVSPVPESSASPSSHGGDSEYDPSRGGASSRVPPRPKRIQSKPVASSASASTSAAAGASAGASHSSSSHGNNATNNNIRIGPNGRPMSREQLRKANHSLIERRRREKINSALSELRSMVPGLGEDGGKGGEFKLEVLERTVLHMRELKQQISELEERLSHMHRVSESEEMDVDDDPRSRSPHERDPYRRSSLASTSNSGSNSRHTSQYSRSNSQSHVQSKYDHGHHYHAPAHHYSHGHGHAHSHVHLHSHSHSHSPPRRAASQSTPPSPSITPPQRSAPISPDPNETEPETDLPPPLTLAQRGGGSDNTDSSGRTISPRPHPPSIASLLASAQTNRDVDRERDAGPGGSSRLGHPSPNIYLPFPTPSPTSPFLTYHGGSAASTSSSVTGPPEPSPFMAPLQNISLFGGALDTPNSLEGESSSRKQPSPPDLAMPPPGHPHNHRPGGPLAAEEAANLLLAFSSPETLRPSKTGSTPLMSALAMPPGQRRNLDSEDFSLDGGTAKSNNGSSNSYHASQHQSHSNSGAYKAPRQGKTARDILRM